MEMTTICGQSNRTRQLDSFTMFIVASPRQNIGGFERSWRFNAANQRDYTSGLNIDLGPSPTAQFSVLNVEGRGFGGAQNLRTHESMFARLHTLVVSSDANDKTVRLMADGQQEGQRKRDGSPMSMDEITVGARYYNNGGRPAAGRRLRPQPTSPKCWSTTARSRRTSSKRPRVPRREVRRSSRTCCRRTG